MAADLLIETHGLRKSYRSRRGRFTAIDGLDLEVAAGGVHGFLGPNGSGKTTTIRLVLGLARPDAGEIKLCGVDVPERLPEVMGSVGAVVEQPRLFNGFSGYNNLRLLAKSLGLGDSHVRRALETVGLAGRADHRYGGYSLGMKQRLAIAAALLKEPRLLVLDEPTNGLDPAGIHEMRSLIRNLADSGTTVLISSHILAEVQQVCDSVSIIGRGKALASGPVAEVLARVSGGATSYKIKVPDPVAASAVLTGAGMTTQPSNGSLLVGGADEPARITELLARQGIYLSGLETTGKDLEAAFLQITEGQGL